MRAGRSYLVQSSRCRSAPSKPSRSGVCLGLAFVVFGLTHVPVVAQQSGTIEGEVRHERTGQPLGAVQISVLGASTGTLSGTNGVYRIPNVPAGVHQIQAQRIGYGTQTQEVEVPAGGTVELSFELAEQALGLDEIVVTGTAGQARRREVGNVIERIDFAEQIVGPASSLDALLQGRAPGVNVTMSSGQVGDGGNIRLRGNVSSALSNQPLIYVDGVRVQNDAYANLTPGGLGQQYGTFATPSPLNDINPDDIERIEIIKGAAATTLFGTEAASGVIQIFTKRGVGGAPLWEVGVEQGVAVKNIHGVQRTLRGNSVKDFPMYRSVTGGHSEYLYLDPWMRNAHRQRVTTSMRGAADRVSYFVSGSYQNDDDIFVVGGLESYSVRGNIGIDLTESLGVDWNTSFSNQDITNVGCGDNLHGICARSSYEGIVGVPREELDPLVYDPDHNTRIDRLVTGATVRFQPSLDLFSRFTVGYDRAANTGRITIPYGFPYQAEGYRSLRSNLQEMVTLDHVTTYTLNPTSAFGVDLSAGFQHVTRQDEQVTAWTERFPGPGEVTLSTGAVSFAQEVQQRVITGGVFGQALFKLNDRYFITAGVRADGSSAFGQDFGWEVYPKVSGSYIISDEAFWPAAAGEMQLRAAWGAAGRAPGAFDAGRTWSPVPWLAQSVFIPANVGNPELGPERTTEIEFGFESSTLDDRLSVAFSWYRQTTTDALINVRQTPSAGNWSSQLENVGQLENRGVELAVSGTPLRRGAYAWDVGVDISTNHSEAIDLGGSPQFSVGGGGFITEGHPVPVIIGSLVRNPNEIADPDIVTNHYFGPNLPTMMVSPHTTATLPGGILVVARGEYHGGHFIRDGASRWSLIEFSQEYPPCFDAYELLAAGQEDQLTALERAWCHSPHFDSHTFIYPADFFKLRELSVRIPVGNLVPRASAATLTLSGRNLYRWVKEEFRAYDPEAGGFTPGHSFTNEIWQQPAPPKLFTAAMRVQF